MSWQPALMQADDRSIRKVSNLQQGAKLVGQPQPSWSGMDKGWSLPVGQRIAEPAGVADLAYQRGTFLPDAQAAGPSAMADAVGGDLVNRRHQLVDSFPVEAGGPCV